MSQGYPNLEPRHPVPARLRHGAIEPAGRAAALPFQRGSPEALRKPAVLGTMR